MKSLTMNRVAAQSLRANKKAYVSLAIGIFLAVYLASAMVLGGYGTVLRRQETVVDRVGYIDAVFLNNGSDLDEAFRDSGLFSRIGKVFVTAQIEETGLYVGYYDEEASALLPRRAVEGRLPEKPGEIALEESALAQLRTDMRVGDTVTWTMLPVDGEAEERTYTLVGILSEQAVYMEAGGGYYSSWHGTSEWPNALVSPDDTPYRVGTPALHRVVTYGPLTTFQRVYSYGQGISNARIQAISRMKGEAHWNDPLVDDLNETAQQTMLWWTLGIALLLAACVGISSAMESMLAQKTEEIGMLRAVGATRRQVRRLFGRDAWLLTLLSLPIGVGMGMLTVWAISLLIPEEVAFGVSISLLLPVMGIAAGCVFLSSRLPLRRAARQTPMGVLRDTGMLRKIRKFKSEKHFRAPRLIAARQVRLHPLRQAGASLMVTLMLLCTVVLGQALLYRPWTPAVDFLIEPVNGRYSSRESGNFSIVEMKTNVLTFQDIQQIRAIPQVKKAKLETETTVNLVLDQDTVPQYLRDYYAQKVTYQYYPSGGTMMTYTYYEFANALNTHVRDNSLGYLLYDTPDRATELPEEYLDGYEKGYHEMRGAAQAFQVNGKLVPIRLAVTDVSELDKYAVEIEGKLNLQALDAGTEVLVYAPDLYLWTTEERGETSWNVSGKWGLENRPDAQFVASVENDYFHPGMTLRLNQAVDSEPMDEVEFKPGSGDAAEAAYREIYQAMDKRYATVTVGAVLKQSAQGMDSNTACIITTEKGLQALGFAVTEPTNVSIHLDGPADQETERAVEERLNRIAMRAGMEVYNYLASSREANERMKVARLVLSGIVILFFAVSVAMQVGNAGRRIRADKRMIGTLRAVGADEKALLGCYRLPLMVTAGLGFLLAAGVYVLCRRYWRTMMGGYYPLLVLTMAGLAGLCLLCCLLGVKARLRQVVKESIVENIREL